MLTAGLDRLTNQAYTVSMAGSQWDYENVRQTLEEFTGKTDPSDPRARKRMRIVRAATELFIRQGYRKTSVAEVARRAGVAKGTVYLYFRNKAELLMHAIAEEKKLIVVRLQPILGPEVPPREKLRRWIAAAFVLVQDMPLTSRLMGGDRELLAAMDDLPEEMGQQFGHMQVDFMAQMVDEASRPHSWSPVEVRDRARVLIGLLYTVNAFGDERIRQGLSLERFGDVLADMIMDGLGGSEDPSGTRGGEQ
jgi:AcrR family transcriptional regulator